MKGFGTIWLAPGETRDVTVRVARDDLAYFDTAADTWLVEDADHRIDVGASSRDIRLTTTVPVDGDAYADQPDADSTVAVWLAHPVGGPAIEALLSRVQKSMGDAYPKEEALATAWSPTCASASSPGSRSSPSASTTYRNWSRRCGRRSVRAIH